MASLGGDELPIIGRIQESQQIPVRASMENSICSVDILGPATFGMLWSHTPQYLTPQDYIFILVNHAILEEIHVAFHDIPIMNVMCCLALFNS